VNIGRNAIIREASGGRSAQSHHEECATSSYVRPCTEVNTITDYHLSRLHTIEFLARISSKSGSGVSTLYVSPGKTLETVVSRGSMVSDVLPDSLVALAQASKNGFCLFGGDPIILFLPPFPISEDAIYQGIETEPVSSMLEKDHVIVIICAPWGVCCWTDTW
jgi:hypothetical protein